MCVEEGGGRTGVSLAPGLTLTKYLTPPQVPNGPPSLVSGVLSAQRALSCVSAAMSALSSAAVTSFVEAKWPAIQDALEAYIRIPNQVRARARRCGAPRVLACAIARRTGITLLDEGW